jgi:hypothetical protein
VPFYSFTSYYGNVWTAIFEEEGMKKMLFLTGIVLICAFTLLLSAPVQGAQDLKIVKVDKAPTLDGTANDAAWRSA